LSLSSADVHVVGLARGLAGYVVPSRLYGILAAGRPVIAAAEEESETAQLVAEVGCGVVVPPGNPFALAGAIRAAYAGEGGRGARAAGPADPRVAGRQGRRAGSRRTRDERRGSRLFGRERDVGAARAHEARPVVLRPGRRLRMRTACPHRRRGDEQGGRLL